MKKILRGLLLGLVILLTPCTLARAAESKGSLFEDSFSVRSVRDSSKTVTFDGANGNYNILLFGGIGSCGNTNAAISYLNDLVPDMDMSEVNIYAVDIKGNAATTINDLLTVYDISDDIQVCSLEDSVYDTYLHCVRAANISGTWIMPLIVVTNDEGEICYFHTAYISKTELEAGITEVLGENQNNIDCDWKSDAKGTYWYEKGKRQGTYKDPNGVVGDGTIRGREIFDPKSGGWYWLDAVYNGAKACNKEVWMPYIYQNEGNFSEKEIIQNAANSGDMAAQVEKAIRAARKGETNSAIIGKWVRYDANGKMIKGWYTVEGADVYLYPKQAGNTYYYDKMTGLMAKGKVTIDGVEYEFDKITGALIRNENSSETDLPDEKVPGQILEAPDLNEPASPENLMKLLHAYDPDGAFILEQVADTFSKFFWIDNPDDSIANVYASGDIDTLVHENFHSYTHTWGGDNIYIGDGQSIYVPRTKVFYSTEMVPVIPDNLRTFRFDTYVNSSNTNMSSIQFGAYGLLNEFSAYYWGMHNTVKMHPYFNKIPWGTASIAQAYAEFRYYILAYMRYAKENHQDVYEGIMGNKEFLKAFCTIDTKFIKLLDEYQKLSDPSYYYYESDIDALMSETEKPEYRQIYNDMYRLAN